MLQVEALSVTYAAPGRPARLAVKNVSFSLPAGQILAVIGPNGAGKSSLVRCLSGVVPACSGRVCIDGRDLGRLSPAERARLLAVVPQARNLPAGFTGWEMVLLGRTPHLNWLGQVGAQDEELAREAMRRTNSLDLAERLVGELSGGEQQRLLLARALAQDTPILLMDEPTTHLDLQHQLSLLEQVRCLAHQEPCGTRRSPLAVLVVLHDLNLVARYADRVALLVEGELRSLGTPQEVLTPDLLSQAYHVPLRVIHGAAQQPLIVPA